MVRLALQDIPYFEVSDLEFERGGTSYMVETLREFKKKNPSSELYLILGSDSYRGLDQWKEPEEIKNLAQLIVADREGTSKIQAARGIHPIPVSFGDFSSTSIRALIENGQDISTFVPEPVKTYIQEQGLYQAGERES